MKQQYTICIFLFSFLTMNILPSLGGAGGGLVAQTWQWGERGGSSSGSSGSGADEYPRDIATDQNGNVYILSRSVGPNNLSIAGTTKTTFGSYDVMLASFNCAGKLRWVKIIGCSREDNGYALQTDKNGGGYFAIISAMFSGAGTNTLNFDTDKSLNVPNTKGGKCYKSVFLAKYDTSGNFQWVTAPQSDTVGSYSYTNTGIIDISIDDKGDLHCLSALPTGIFENNYVVNKQGTYILKYNRNGTFLGGVAPDVNITGYSIGSTFLKIDNRLNRYLISGSIDLSSPVYIGGTQLKSAKYIAAFDNIGRLLWSRSDTTPSINNGINNRPEIDVSGNIYIVSNTGYFYNEKRSDYFNGYTTKVSNDNPPEGGVLVMKMDKDGNMLWADNAITNNASFTGGIALRNSGEVIVGGWYNGLLRYDTFKDSLFFGPNQGYRPFIARFNTQTGKVLGLEELIPPSGSAQVLDMISDNRNNIYISGELTNSLTVNGTVLSSAGGSKDFYVAKYGYAGCNCTNIPEPKFTQTVANHFEYTFNYTGTSGTTMEWDFGDGTTSNQTNPTHIYTTLDDFIACVKVTNSCGDNIYCTKISTKWPAAISNIGDGNNIKIYPNPANDVLHVEGIEPGSRIELYDMLGRKAHEIITAKEKEEINITYLPAGNYIIQLTDRNGQRITGKVVKR